MHIFFEKENIHTEDADSELMITIFGSIAQEESINIGNSIAWGKRSQAERGIIKVGTANYGYRIGEKFQWMIHEEEAKIVRRIYADIQAGKNYTQIITALTHDRIPTPQGREIWSLSTVKEILTNVDKKGKSTKPHTRQEFFNLFTCSECGAPIIHIRCSSDESYYWRCRTAEKKYTEVTCNVRGFREESIEHRFMTLLQELKMTEGYQDKMKQVFRNSVLTKMNESG